MRSPVKALAGAVVVSVLLAGCGGDTEAEPVAKPTEPLWNPCDALDAQVIGKAMGATYSVQSGTPSAPECRLTPTNVGDAALTANYQLFSAGLDAAWETMGDFEDAKVAEPPVSGADASRLVVQVDHNQLYISGFVQNGDLIQSVNVVDPAPFPKDRVRRATKEVMAALSLHAADASVPGATEAPSPVPPRTPQPSSTAP